MEIKTLKEESDELHRKLNRRNDYKMTDIIAYLRDQDLTEASFETIRNRLLKEALAAQNSGRAIETVFGYEPTEYVDEEVRRAPSATPEEKRYETFRLWGFALVVLTGLSIGYDLMTDVIARIYGQIPQGAWTFSFSDLAFFIILLGISVTLSAHFSRYRLLNDPDFFSNSGNRLGSFIKTYGLTLLIVLLGLGLLVFTGGEVLFELPFATAGLILAGLAIAWYVILRILRGRARHSR